MWLERAYGIVAVLGILAGCGGMGGGGDGGGGAGGTAGGGAEPVVEIRASLGAIEWGQGGCSAGQQCARVDVPLDWSNEASERISLFLRRMPAVGKRKGQIWLLAGGPGQSADGLMASAIPTVFTAQGLDVYSFDNRGVGRSTALGCDGDAGSDVSPACMDALAQRWGRGLDLFSTTAAAVDLGMLVEALRVQGERTFVWGGSYGTLVANRYLALFPDQSDGAILDSICPPAGCRTIAHRDEAIEKLVRAVLADCGSDPFCSSKLSADPWSRLEKLYERFDAGHCRGVSAGGEKRFLSSALSQLFGDSALVEIGLAAIYRFERCGPVDKAALQHLERTLFGPQAGADTPVSGDSRYLNRHVVLSEFWEDGLTPASLRAESDGLVVSLGYGERWAGYRERWSWPLYETPSALERWARTSIPLLFLNGTLDFATPPWDLADLPGAYRRPGQNFVVVPFQGHMTMMDVYGEADPCVASIAAAFVRDPAAAPDAGCLVSRAFPDVHGDAQMAQWSLGTDDPWGDSGASAAALSSEPGAEPPPRGLAALRRVRALLAE